MEIQNIELHRVVATAIIHQDGKYLILRRSLNKKVFPGRWTVPGGGLEVTDYINTPKTTPDAWYFALEDSLKREIKDYNPPTTSSQPSAGPLKQAWK